MFYALVSILFEGEYANVAVHQEKSTSAWDYFIQQRLRNDTFDQIQCKRPSKGYNSWIWFRVPKDLAIRDETGITRSGKKK